MRRWNGRGTGHPVGGGQANDSEEEAHRVHPIVKKIEKDRREARQAEEDQQDDEGQPLELNDIDVGYGGHPDGNYQRQDQYEEQEESYGQENGPDQHQAYPHNNGYADPRQQYQYDGQMNQMQQ